MRKYLLDPILELFKRNRVKEEVQPPPPPKPVVKQEERMFAKFTQVAPEDDESYGALQDRELEDSSDSDFDADEPFGEELLQAQNLTHADSEQVQDEVNESNGEANEIEAEDSQDQSDSVDDTVKPIQTGVLNASDLLKKHFSPATNNPVSPQKSDSMAAAVAPKETNTQSPPQQQPMDLVLAGTNTGKMIESMAKMNPFIGSGSSIPNHQIIVIMNCAKVENIGLDQIRARITQEEIRNEIPPGNLLNQFNVQMPTAVSQQNTDMSQKKNSAFSHVADVVEKFDDEQHVKTLVNNRSLHSDILLLKESSGFQALKDNQLGHDLGKKNAHFDATGDKVIKSIEKLDKLLERAEKHTNGPISSITKHQIRQHLTEMKKDPILMDKIKSLDSNKPQNQEKVTHNESAPQRPSR